MTIKRGDTKNAIHAFIKQNGLPVDLTDCTVKFFMSNGVEAVVEIMNAQKGEVFYSLKEETVGKTGFYNYEFKVIYEDQRIETFPNDGYLKLRIYDDLRGGI